MPRAGAARLPINRLQVGPVDTLQNSLCPQWHVINRFGFLNPDWLISSTRPYDENTSSVYGTDAQRSIKLGLVVRSETGAHFNSEVYSVFDHDGSFAHKLSVLMQSIVCITIAWSLEKLERNMLYPTTLSIVCEWQT